MQDWQQREKMQKLSEINIRPLRIAFDHYAQRDVYIDAVTKAAECGIMELSNYLLYNFEDEPSELYYRMKINVDLCEKLGGYDILLSDEVSPN